MNTIAIDCGASFIKGALIKNGVIEYSKRISAPPVHKSENLLDTSQIQALVAVVKELLRELSDGQDEVKLCIANEMHGFLLAYPDGTPFTDYISWQKEFGLQSFNGVSAVSVLGGKEYEEDILYSGMSLRAGLPSSNLLYLKLSGTLKKAERPLCFYTLGDYLARVLSDRTDVPCHPTNSAATGLYDLKTGDWNKRLIAAVGGEGIAFPRVGSEEVVFELNDTKVHLLPAIGDQQAALLGAGLRNEGEMSFNLGTGAQVSKLVTDIKRTPEYQIRPFFFGKYLKTIPHLLSGRALNVYIRFFKDVLKNFGLEPSDEEIWNVLLCAEKSFTNSDIKCDLSFFENPITPATTGSIENIGEYALTTANLVHSLITSMAGNFLWAANVIEADRTKIGKLVFSGGIASKIEALRDIIIADFDKNVDVVVAQNETFLGLYEYGLIAE